MKSNNITTQFFLFMGILLITFGISGFNTNDLSFTANQKAHSMLLAGIFSLLYTYYRIRKEKTVQNNDNDKLD